MGKRKKSSRKPTGPRQREPLDTTFTCIFCHHEKSVTVRLDKKESIAQLACKVCDQRFQATAHQLTEPIDVYSQWIDAADEAEKERTATRRPAASSSRAPAAAALDSDED